MTTNCSCEKGDQGIHRHEDCPVHGADVRAGFAARRAVMEAVQAAAVTRRLNRQPGRKSPARAAGLGLYGAERETFPYWKAQYFEPRAFAWKDVQAKHHEKAVAVAEGLRLKAKHGRARLMEVQAQGRTPLAEL